MIGIGIDTVEVDRFRTAVARTPRILDRLLTPAERAYCERQRDPTQRYAARFAAKEAVMKALGVGLGAFAFDEVEVANEPSGRPVLRLRGGALALADQRGVRDWHLSLSHSHLVAEAVAVAL